MKTNLLLPCVLIAALGTSCMQTRNITEEYIKNNIEDHNPRSTSSIRTYSIYKSQTTTSTTRYLELTGYKYNGQKGLVIGADLYGRSGAPLTGLPIEQVRITYVVLTEEQCRQMLEKEVVIKGELKSAPRATTSEEAYSDYTVTEDVFISYRKTASRSNPTYIDIWVGGHKYSMQGASFKKKMKKFLSY